ncbi:MAG: SRPBCC domain-containing protein [Verrucomicrobiales bacterium]|nr:SRPBCC domain-containing protein [Verrucomicrobiales bacterium]
MKSTCHLEAPTERCQQVWLVPDLLNQWLSTSAAWENEDLALTSRLPNISGRHRLVERSGERLVFDWYIDGFRTRLELDFEPDKEGTLLTLTHTALEPIPEGLLFPPGKYYADQVWNFALNNLQHFLTTGKKAMEMQWPHNLHRIDLEIVIDAKPEGVWDFLTTVENLKASSLVEDTATIEPRVGGRYSFGWVEMEDDKIDGPGFITDWIEGEKLSVSWYGGRDSIVSWQLSGEGKNATRVKFSHTGMIFALADTLSYQFGWSEFLLEMKQFLEEADSTGK